MKRPPGPRGREVLGFLGRGNVSRTLTFLEQSARRFGPISYFRFLNQQIYLIDDPSLIEEVLVKQQHKFRRDNGATILRELVGDGLLTRDEPQHRERRRLLQPAFHRAQISSYADTMVQQTERLSREWNPESSAGSIVDIGAEMKRLTLAIVGACLFGADFTDSASEIAQVLRQVVKRSSKITPFVALFEPLMRAYRRMAPGGPSLFYRKERAQLERILAPVIGQHRQDAASNDLLSMLLAARDEQSGKLNDEDLRNEVVTLVLAGHETTATALTWAWYLIASHPSVEERLHAEIDTVLGDRLPSMEDVPRLPYTALVFTEAMRLYPPALAFGRRPLEPVTLGGYIIPRGASVFVSPYVTQRNERFFERPFAFEPDRWQTISLPKFAYFPFGGGAKMCIGESFAKLEGVLVLAVLAQRWRLQSVSGSEVLPTAGITLSPERPILLHPIQRVRRFTPTLT